MNALETLIESGRVIYNIGDGLPLENGKKKPNMIHVHDAAAIMESYFKPIDLNKLFKQWCKETKRSGGVIVGSSVREFFDYVTKQIYETNL